MVFGGGGEVTRISGELGHAEVGPGYAKGTLNMPGMAQVAVSIGKPPSWADTFKNMGLVLGGILSFAVALFIFPVTIVGAILLVTDDQTQKKVGFLLALPLVLGIIFFTEAGIITRS